jgi:hypothetical protein
MKELWRKLPECSGCDSTLGRCTHGIRNGAIACCPDCEHYVRVDGPVYRECKHGSIDAHWTSDITEAWCLGLVEVGEEQT